MDLIGGYSNKAYLRNQYTDQRKRLQALPFRPSESTRIDRTRHFKRRLDREETDQIIAKYRSGISTNQLMTEHQLAVVVGSFTGHRSSSTLVMALLS